MPRSWYSIQAAADNPRAAEISIYDEIGYWGVTAKDFIGDLRALGDVDQIVLRINSPGGDVFDGTSIYNLLRDHKASVTVKIDGWAASIASMIAMAGDTIEMPANTMMMIHNPWGFAVGDSDDMALMAAVLDKVKAATVTAYERKTGLSRDDISALMDAETWMTAEEAVAKGFATAVTDAIEVKNRVDLTRFRNAPKPPSNPPPAQDNANPPPADPVDITRGTAAEIAELCALAGQPARAAAFIRDGAAVAAVRAALLDGAAAASSPELVNTPPGDGQPAAAQVIDRAAIYAARNRPARNARR